MFELVKILVEAIAKSFSPKAILDARKNQRLSEIGTEVFLVYTYINDILVVGREIVRELESGLDWMRRKIDEGEADQCLLTHIDFLLNQQSINILKLVRSIKRLRHALELISPEVYVKLVPLLEGKGNAISALIDALSAQKPYLISVDTHKLEMLLERVSNEVESSTPTPFELDKYCEELHEMMTREEIDNISYIPASSHDMIKAYLEARRPSQVIDEIEAIAKQLHESIQDNFSVKDILLKVGDSRLALHEPYV